LEKEFGKSLKDVATTIVEQRKLDLDFVS
jgi:hypothetical protein